MSEVKAKVILDSISLHGYRLTTFEVTFHRFILAEFNTHRVFSRNSASSRAIPIHKQIQRLVDEPAIPVEFGTNQKGMQAGPPLEGSELREAEDTWLDARDEAIRAAIKLDELGVHKQVVNRLLEPFMWHTVIVTSVDYDNFFHQRCSPLAQPEIEKAADAMLEAYRASTPEEMGFGAWHTPYILEEEYDQLGLHDRLKISAARCARVSYLTHDGRRDLQADLSLYERLVTADPPHWSPLEHVATPSAGLRLPLGNFPGWEQLRHSHLSKEL